MGGSEDFYSGLAKTNYFNAISLYQISFNISYAMEAVR